MRQWYSRARGQLALQLLIDLRKRHRTRAAMSISMQLAHYLGNRTPDAPLVHADDVARAVLPRRAMHVDRPVIAIREECECTRYIGTCRRSSDRRRTEVERLHAQSEPRRIRL